ncbi:MAG: hypothetical protein DWH78_02065 [Planctomycetota bacterium]|nr:MAG: hypothetical protein DWH78_02065 [Planctomycetota bacterium]
MAGTQHCFHDRNIAIDPDAVLPRNDVNALHTEILYRKHRSVANVVIEVRGILCQSLGKTPAVSVLQIHQYSNESRHGRSTFFEHQNSQILSPTDWQVKGHLADTNRTSCERRQQKICSLLQAHIRDSDFGHTRYRAV